MAKHGSRLSVIQQYHHQQQYQQYRDRVSIDHDRNKMYSYPIRTITQHQDSISLNK